MKLKLIIAAVLLFPQASVAAQTGASQVQPSDPFLWLEPTHSPKALQWVKAQNQKTLSVLAQDPRYKIIREKILKILEAPDKLAYPNLRGKWVYNFWQDRRHVRGVWRRALISDYSTPHPHWQNLLDIDELAKKEKKNWVWQGAECLPSSQKRARPTQGTAFRTRLPPIYHRCLLNLSDGGTDAKLVREFDIPSRSFVKDGFNLPNAKSETAWLNQDAILVATDFGPGTLTSSGYPRIVKLWKRHTPLSQAQTLFKGKETDMEAYGFVNFRPSGPIAVIVRTPAFFRAINYWISPHQKLKRIPIPEDADLKGFFKGLALAVLRSDWKTPSGKFLRGDLISWPMADIDKTHPERFASLVYRPKFHETIEDVFAARSVLYLSILKNVRGQILEGRLKNSRWSLSEIKLPQNGATDIVSGESLSNTIFTSYQDFLTPTTLYLKDRSGLKAVKKLPARFDAQNLVSEQIWTHSKDGTPIPYFVIHQKQIKLNGKNPTLLYGYGGFEISMTPFYSGIVGKIWLRKGGVYALANIRGGGEFGPAWHEAALKTHRQKAYDDFLAVAKDLIQRKITSPRHLGIMGGSNGGLLVGAAFTEKPNLFNAVVCQVPLLDMLRYTHIGAGASWIAEYGDPQDPKMAAAISRYSPYQNVKPGVHYPQVFFLSSKDDDRVAPAHARKMAAKMESFGDPVFYYETSDGGHHEAANLEKAAKEYALEYAYLFERLFPNK
jgi:prolyl oligopeptidase